MTFTANPWLSKPITVGLKGHVETALPATHEPIFSTISQNYDVSFSPPPPPPPPPTPQRDAEENSYSRQQKLMNESPEKKDHKQHKTTKSKLQISEKCTLSLNGDFPNDIIPAYYSITTESLETNFPALIVLDTETTGLSAMDHVIEIGAVEVLKGQITNRRFWRACRPEIPQIPQSILYGGHVQPIFIDNPIKEYSSAAKLHGMTNEFLRREGKPAAECIREFRKFAETSSEAARIMMMNTTTPMTVDDALMEVYKQQEEQKDVFDKVSSVIDDGTMCKENNISVTNVNLFDFIGSGLISKGVIVQEPKLQEIKEDVREGGFTFEKPTVKLVAHNLSFDWRFINTMSSRYNVPIAPVIAQKEDCLCTQRLFRLMYPGQPYSLQDVCNFLGIDRNPSEQVRHGMIGDYRNKGANNAHSALTDAYVTAEALMKLVKIGDLAKKIGITYKNICR